MKPNIYQKINCSVTLQYPLLVFAYIARKVKPNFILKHRLGAELLDEARCLLAKKSCSLIKFNEIYE